jgi:hypothetical protein
MTRFQKNRLVPVAQKLAPRRRGIDVAWQNERDPDSDLFTLNDDPTLKTLDEIRAESKAGTLIVVEYHSDPPPDKP